MADQHKAWQESNPLREWRKREGLSINGTASLLRVSLKTLQLWESGAANPTEINLARVAGLMNLKPATLQSRWWKWKEIKPDPIGEAS